MKTAARISELYILEMARSDDGLARRELSRLTTLHPFADLTSPQAAGERGYCQL